MLPKDEKITEPWRDPIVEEIHRIREEHAARFNFDLDAIARDLQKRQYESGHKVVSFAKERIPTDK
ncbi:MAG: hypothetical protein IT426_18600 [Pirellulales bacterium]|nr:hypothetical protein [Pirellulales bacterium]